MLHMLLIALHAASGVIALAAGAFVFQPPRGEPPSLFRVYLGALSTMALALAAVVAVDWPALDAAGRIVFGALTLFALVIAWRGWRARQDIRGRRPGWEHPYEENVRFTLVALFTGFVVIAVLDLGAPVWLVILTGLVAILGGHFGLGRAERRLAA